MTGQDSTDQIWEILNFDYPHLCVSKYAKYSTEDLLLEPKSEADRDSQNYKEACKFYAHLKTLPMPELEGLVEDRHPFNRGNMLATSDVFEFWSRAELWHEDECVALINGRNPLFLTRDRIDNDKSESKIFHTLKQTQLLLRRAYQAGVFFGKTPPQRVVQWAELKQIAMPGQLVELINRRSGKIVSAAKENVELKGRMESLQNELQQLREKQAASAGTKSASPRQHDSLLKLVLGMAIGGYGYNPKASKSTQTKAIADDLRKCGIPLDEGTVLKYLTEAKTEFADKLTEQFDP
jgi:hypothetical protein